MSSMREQQKKLEDAKREAQNLVKHSLRPKLLVVLDNVPFF